MINSIIICLIRRSKINQCTLTNIFKASEKDLNGAEELFVISGMKGTSVNIVISIILIFEDCVVVVDTK